MTLCASQQVQDGKLLHTGEIRLCVSIRTKAERNRKWKQRKLLLQRKANSESVKGPDCKGTQLGRHKMLFVSPRDKTRREKEGGGAVGEEKRK